MLSIHFDSKTSRVSRRRTKKCSLSVCKEEPFFAVISDLKSEIQSHFFQSLETVDAVLHFPYILHFKAETAHNLCIFD